MIYVLDLVSFLCEFIRFILTRYVGRSISLLGIYCSKFRTNQILIFIDSVIKSCFRIFQQHRTVDLTKMEIQCATNKRMFCMRFFIVRVCDSVRVRCIEFHENVRKNTIE